MTIKGEKKMKKKPKDSQEQLFASMCKRNLLLALVHRAREAKRIAPIIVSHHDYVARMIEDNND